MEVFLKIEHRKTSFFTEAKESTTVLELKRIVQGFVKRPPKDQLLFKDDQLLEERKTLRDCGFTSEVAKQQDPAIVTLAFREDAFQLLHARPFSCPLIGGVLKNGLDLERELEYVMQ
ncbi:elongin-B-like [Rattus rattus]|uniref:elongin-B-like n=1 Tax=Rattus rattus TaxID=10117 RepID=UPI0013F3004F|nr:elongin-B-like [Rattus rattus]